MLAKVIGKCSLKRRGVLCNNKINSAVGPETAKERETVLRVFLIHFYDLQ